MMTDKYKIVGSYIKDMSSETPDIDTYIFVKDHISKYRLNIDIKSIALKNKHIEINTTLTFSDKSESKKKSFFEIVYSTIIRITEDIKEQNDLKKIILCEVPAKIYPDLQKFLITLLHNSGYPEIKIDKKIDFEELYNNKSN